MGQEPTGSLAWYVTWDNGVQKCTQDCPNNGGEGGVCGGLITVGVVTYESVDACCETALSTMRLEECQAVSNGEVRVVFCLFVDCLFHMACSCRSFTHPYSPPTYLLIFVGVSGYRTILCRK